MTRKTNDIGYIEDILYLVNSLWDFNFSGNGLWDVAEPLVNQVQKAFSAICDDPDNFIITLDNGKCIYLSKRHVEALETQATVDGVGSMVDIARNGGYFDAEVIDTAIEALAQFIAGISLEDEPTEDLKMQVWCLSCVRGIKQEMKELGVTGFNQSW